MTTAHPVDLDRQRLVPATTKRSKPPGCPPVIIVNKGTGPAFWTPTPTPNDDIQPTDIPNFESQPHFS